MEDTNIPDFDCESCGACCKNLPQNHRQGVTYWVQIEPTDKILTRKDLKRKYVTYDRHRIPHLKMARDGKCQCLTGELGKKVSCRIYHQRPTPCRRVQPGDDKCLLCRAEQGITQ